MPKSDFLKEENSDPGKLAVMDKTGFLDGEQLYEMLLHKYHLQPEMAAGRYVLAMFTIGDTKEGYERLTKALLEIDEYITAERKQRTQEKLMEERETEWQMRSPRFVYRKDAGGDWHRTSLGYTERVGSA